MAEYLIRSGIGPDRVIREARSTSTRENFAYSRKYMDPATSRVGIVTNGFHIFRAEMIAKQEGYRHICGIPATSNPVFQVNYLTREFFAVLYLLIKSIFREKRGHNESESVERGGIHYAGIKMYGADLCTQSAVPL